VTGGVSGKRDVLVKGESIQKVKKRRRGRAVRCVNMDVKITSYDEFRGRSCKVFE